MTYRRRINLAVVLAVGFLGWGMAGCSPDDDEGGVGDVSSCREGKSWECGCNRDGSCVAPDTGRDAEGPDSGRDGGEADAGRDGGPDTDADGGTETDVADSGTPKQRRWTRLVGTSGLDWIGDVTTDA
ncbi:MAG: hypothetical protein ABEN55_09575 [Bradymonadaceae bacterium]